MEIGWAVRGYEREAERLCEDLAAAVAVRA